MNFFFHPCMLPEIYKMAISHRIAELQVQEIRRIAKERGISPKYIKKEHKNETRSN
jgi:hypothetical protein